MNWSTITNNHLKKNILFILLLTIASFTNIFVYSQWSSNPSNNLVVGYGQNPELTSDSTAGCYITYIPEIVEPYSLRLVRLDRYGYQPWGTYLRIRGELSSETSPKITADGNTGVLIAFLDQYTEYQGGVPILTSRLRAQHIDSSGNFLWDPIGVRASVSETNQFNPAIISDGKGGCIIAWKDTMNMIRLQRITKNGAEVWGDSGKFVWNSSSDVNIYSDGNSGCYVSFEFFYIQRIDSNGTLYWDNQGIRIPTGVVRMSHDTSKNLYLFGGKFIGYYGSVNVWTANLQKLNPSGSLLWDSSGIFLDTIYDGGGLTRNRIITTCNGISFLAWDNIVNTSRKTYGQIVSASGKPLNTLPFKVNSLSSDEWTPEITLSDSQSAIYMWRDYDQIPSQLFIQRFNSDGIKMWDTMNVTASVPALTYEKIITDCNGGCIVVGFREDFSIRAQQVSRYGKLGEVITSVDEEMHYPEKIQLYQNYPNPFNPSTTISFDLIENGNVLLKVYNILGQEVATLVNGFQSIGYHSIALDDANLPGGIYVYRLQTSRYTEMRKMVLIK